MHQIQIERPHSSADVTETSPRSSDDKQMVDVQPTSLATAQAEPQPKNRHLKLSRANQLDSAKLFSA